MAVVLTEKGRELAANAAARGHAASFSGVADTKQRRVVCSCGRLDVTSESGPFVVDALYRHFNIEAG